VQRMTALSGWTSMRNTKVVWEAQQRVQTFGRSLDDGNFPLLSRERSTIAGYALTGPQLRSHVSLDGPYRNQLGCSSSGY
jgi:hypothetical protein